MFSPQLYIGDALLNPAARRRARPSRPTSRVQMRRERSSSGMSVDSSRDESSVGVSQQQDSEGTTNATREMSIIRQSSTATSGKDQDGGMTDLVTKNDKYRVSKLPGTPQKFSSYAKNRTPCTAYADSTHRFALLLAHEGAYVWEYATPHTLPLTFSFPFKSGSKPDLSTPFPLGALVSPSANSKEPGLVVVQPTTGMIAYWDAVSSAVSEGLFTKRRGVEGEFPTLSGEVINSICSAEPAGFVISTSSGRLAHLALRDAAGRPGISVTIMRNGGFGGILGALRAGSNRRDIVAVRAGKVLRMGEREVFVVTTRGNFSRWHVNRTGGYANTTDVDLREDILTALSGQKRLQGKSTEHFQVVDLQITGYSEGVEANQGDTVQLLVLTAIPSANTNAAYAIVSLEVMASGAAAVGDVHVIKSYTEGFGSETPPRLYFPPPRKTAFVVFPRAVVVISKIRRDPSVEEMDYDNGQQEPFEDVVDFRGDLGIEIVGSGSEGVENDMTIGIEAMGSFSTDQVHVRRIKNPGVILIAKNAGILRVEAFDSGTGAKAVTAPVTVKSKLEQAVFYGTKSDNPLNFLGRSEVRFSVQDLENAALEISQEILGSRSPYVPAQLPSLGSHLELRSLHLRALVQHLRTGAFGQVSKPVLWRLLQDAEKCEAARAVWTVRNDHLREDPESGDGVLGAVIAEYLPTADADNTGNDPIRAWFQREVVQIGELLRHVKKSLTTMPDKGKKNQLSLAVSDSEANDIIIGALEAAWGFRVSSAKLYELSGPRGIDKNGMLENSNGYQAPWTSDIFLLEALSTQRDISEATIKAVLGPTEDSKWRDVVSKLSDQLVHLAEICCRAFEERGDWCDQQIAGNEDILQEGRNVRERYLHSRGGWIKPLVNYGLIYHAYGIAEDYLDYRTLVEICSGELLKVEVALLEFTPAHREDAEAIGDLKETKAEVGKRLESYFERFGEPFATEMYDYLIENGKLQTLLNGFESWRERYLTPFLRGNPKYAKLSWIHDVSLGDYNTAANTLLNIATKSEDFLSNQRIGLSIGKLAKLAALENASASEMDVMEEIESYDVKLNIVKVQQRLYAAVKHITHGAIDVEAAVQLAMDEYGKKLKKLPALGDLFKRLFKELVSDKVMAAEDLAELLTLIEPNGGDLGDESFYWALRVIGLEGLPKEKMEMAEKSIWRRCFLKDDWTHIVSTRNRTDEDVAELARQTSVYTTLLLCYSRGLFSHGSPFNPKNPEEALFSENPEDIRIRFPESDGHLLEALAHDLYEENRRLKRHISKADLQSWFAGMLAQIKEEVDVRVLGVEDGDEDGDQTMDV